LRWGSILRNSQLAGAEQAAYAFHDWLKDMIARNRPYDEFVRGVVAAAGEWQEAPAGNWVWPMRGGPLHPPGAAPPPAFPRPRLPRPAPSGRQGPPPPPRARGPGRLLRAGRLLRPAGPQGAGRASDLLLVPDAHHGRGQPAHREADRAEVARRPRARGAARG